MLSSGLLKWEALGGRSGVVSVGALFGSAEGSQPAMMRPVTNKLNKHAHFSRLPLKRGVFYMSEIPLVYNNFYIAPRYQDFTYICNWLCNYIHHFQLTSEPYISLNSLQIFVKFWILNLMTKPNKPYDTTPRLDPSI